MQVFRVSKRLGAVAAAGLLAAGAVLVAEAPAVSAAPSTRVDCATTSLQTAIDNAAAGTTLIVTGTCGGNFTIGKSLTLLGQGTAVLDGQQTGTTLTVVSGTVNLNDLTITGGTGTNIEGLTAGGGILNSADPSVGNGGGNVTLRDSVVSGNSAIIGGGIYSGGADGVGSLTLQGTTVSGNTGIAAGGGIANIGNATLANSTVSGNTQLLVIGGGGILNNGALTLNHTKVSGNRGSSGGGISNDTNVTVNDSTITGNTASSNGGGIDNFGSATLNESTVSANTAGQNGGGGINNEGGGVALRETTVTSNVPDNCFPTGSVAGCAG